MTELSTAGDTNTTLVRLARARAALAEARTLDDVLKIRDIARASEVLLRAAREAGDAANDAAEVRILAEHKAGGMLREMKDNKQRASSGGDYTSSNSKTPTTSTLSDMGVTRMESHRWQRLSDIDPVIIEAYTKVARSQGKEITTAGLLQTLREAESTLWRGMSKNAPVLEEGMELRIGNCREVLADIPDNSVSMVLTDPPYGNVEGVEPLYRWLAEFAARVLIPGGSMICLTGQINFNRDIRIFDQYLTYHWTIARFAQSRHAVIHTRGVLVGWKPMLWYTKQGRWGKQQVYDVINCAPESVPDYLDHDWQQSTEGIDRLVTELTQPGELIVDPFAGTCAWGRTVAGLGRRWIGSDIVEGGTTVAQ